ncbi:HotDog domain-containing protein [Endogone sp. FLAS-F59071]|nr:HotDog domain-containing protein [Endogone sp. FLAS-F59071]|eukprot:RUS21662.1 HotDog domain-containing protein [Endogone sp. FLAS-F59071]
MPNFEIDVSKAVGYKSKPMKVIYNRRDLIMYALAIGVKGDEFKYLYELDPSFSIFPTYPLVLQSKGSTFDVNVFAEQEQVSEVIPGLPEFDINRMVHGEQQLEILKQPPVQGEFWLKSEVTGVFDKGSGTVVERTTTMVDGNDVSYVKMLTKMFFVGYGGWGGPKGPKPVSFSPPKRTPDAVDITPTNPSQALLYRLSGDYNPLHADPAIAPMIGFEKPILHGLCSYGAAAHAVLKHLGENDAARFKKIEGRFAKPVFPGDTLVTSMWKSDANLGTADEETILFVTSVKERGVVVISNGVVILKKGADQATKAKL